MRTVVVALLVGGGVLLAAPAEACGGCAYPPFAPSVALPANLSALPARRDTTLGRSDGTTPIPFTVFDDGIRLDGGLVAGQPVVLTTGAVCGGTSSVTLNIGVEQPKPASAGTLTVTPKRGTFQLPTSAGTCFANVRGDGVTVELVPDAALEPWLALSKAEVWVDGELRDSSLTWGVPGVTSQRYSAGELAGRYVFDVFGACGASGGLSSGTHQGELRVKIIGEADLPALPFEMTVNCDDTIASCACSHAGPGLVLALVFLRRARKRVPSPLAGRATVFSRGDS